MLSQYQAAEPSSLSSCRWSEGGGMSIFDILTPLTYLALIIAWSVVLVYFTKDWLQYRYDNKAIGVLLFVLIIDAFRTLFESVYFGIWQSARIGWLPEDWYEIFAAPQYVIIPKLVTLVAGILIVVILLRRLLPSLVIERKQQEQQIQALSEENHQRKEAEALLRKQEFLLSEAQHIARVGNWVWDISSNNITWADEIYRIFGIEKHAHELDYSDFIERLHPEDRDSVEGAVKAAIENNAPYNLQHRVVRPDGMVRVVHERAFIARNDNGEATAMHGTVQDVTEQKEAEDALVELQLNFQNIIDHMPSILIGVAPDGRVTHWNQEAIRVCGISAEEATEKTYAKACPLLIEYAESVEAAITDNSEKKINLVRHHIDGSTRYSDIMIYPLDREKTVGVVIRIDDVTERVRLEEVLLHSEKMQMIGGLGSGMAHELNSPIGGILYGLQNIRRRLSSGHAKNINQARDSDVDLAKLDHYLTQRGIWNIVEHIEQAGQRASSIVYNMLKFSHSHVVSKEPTNLENLLDNTLELANVDYDLRRRFDFSNIQVVREYEEGVMSITCKATDIQQVVLNLLKNAAWAIRQTEDGNGEIHMRLSAVDNGAQIEVTDNGCGMSEVTRRSVFEPFFTTKEAGDGSGLGLSISYFIVVDQHQGNLEVLSTPGKGSTFRIWLP